VVVTSGLSASTRDTARHDAVVLAHRRRRRPSGEVTPPARPIYRSGKLYLLAIAALAAIWFGCATAPRVVVLFDDVDAWLLARLASLRRDAVVDVATVVQVLASEWVWRAARWTTIAGALVLRRFRHLAVYAALLLVVTATTTIATQQFARPPTDVVAVLDRPETFTHPSEPVVALGLSLVGALYMFAPRGRARNGTKVGTAVVLGLFVTTRLVLGLDHPTDAAAALVLGVTLPIVAFRYLAPNGAFPIIYGCRATPRLRTDHATAIRGALESSFGWRTLDIQAMRPPGSSGSTPIRITVEDGAGNGRRVLFTKLYSIDHLRSDRWYKFGRAIRFGRLEDEAPFASVRQLVEHEDYALRLAAAAGLPVPETMGYVELTAGREYLLVLEQLPDARQLGAGPLTRDVIDQGLAIVRGLWSAGLAHRDIKPANLVVSGRRLFLVDLSFAEVRPSSWREAVDLATMMLTLGVYTAPDLVYQRALRLFSADEIGEAFAAARSVTIPTQLRAVLRARAPHLAAQFAALAPRHPRIAIQRWSPQRLALTVATAAGVVGAFALLVFNLETAGLM
jgi:tRNA A-37 threonylcarbamoyl transferase component Bud32